MGHPEDHSAISNEILGVYEEARKRLGVDSEQMRRFDEEYQRILLHSADVRDAINTLWIKFCVPRNAKVKLGTAKGHGTGQTRKPGN